MTKSGGCQVCIDQVDFSYDGRLILEQASADLAPGDFVGVIGPNGGGKTTLLKLVAGLLQPTGGSVTVSPPAKRQLRGTTAYVPQRLEFDKDFPITALEVVLGGCLSWAPSFVRYSTKQKLAALEALERVDMASAAHESFGHLSGGQAQRVLIARALVAEPALLLLDEPTANVDSQAEQQIYELICALKGSMTIMMVTHHLPMLIDSVDSVITVQRKLGRMSPEQVCDHYGLGLYHHHPMREESP